MGYPKEVNRRKFEDKIFRDTSERFFWIVSKAKSVYYDMQECNIILL